MTVLQATFRIERGISFAGLAVSPAVIPISSVPEKAKLTEIIAMKTARKPFGNSPPCEVKFDSIGASPEPCNEIKPNIAAPPKIINKRMVTILTLENQNSVSANNLTENALAAKGEPRKSRSTSRRRCGETSAA